MATRQIRGMEAASTDIQPTPALQPVPASLPTNSYPRHPKSQKRIAALWSSRKLPLITPPLVSSKLILSLSMQVNHGLLLFFLLLSCCQMLLNTQTDRPLIGVLQGTSCCLPTTAVGSGKHSCLYDLQIGLLRYALHGAPLEEYSEASTGAKCSNAGS